MDGPFGLSFFTAFLASHLPEHPNSFVIVWQNPIWNFSPNDQLKWRGRHFLAFGSPNLYLRLLTSLKQSPAETLEPLLQGWFIGSCCGRSFLLCGCNTPWFFLVCLLSATVAAASGGENTRANKHTHTHTYMSSCSTTAAV